MLARCWLLQLVLVAHGLYFPLVSSRFRPVYRALQKSRSPLSSVVVSWKQVCFEHLSVASANCLVAEAILGHFWCSGLDVCRYSDRSECLYSGIYSVHLGRMAIRDMHAFASTRTISTLTYSTHPQARPHSGERPGIRKPRCSEVLLEYTAADSKSALITCIRPKT